MVILIREFVEIIYIYHACDFVLNYFKIGGSVRNWEYAIQVQSINIQEVRCGTGRLKMKEKKEKKFMSPQKKMLLPLLYHLKPKTFVIIILDLSIIFIFY